MVEITGRLWFDHKNGWYICKDLDPPAWVMSKEKGHEVMEYNGDRLADFLTRFVKSGQAFKVTIESLDQITDVRYYDGIMRKVKE